MTSFAKLYQLVYAHQLPASYQAKEIKPYFETLMPWLTHSAAGALKEKQKLAKTLNSIHPNHYLNAILFETYDIPVADDQYESKEELYVSVSLITEESIAGYFTEYNEKHAVLTEPYHEEQFKQLAIFFGFLNPFINNRKLENDTLARHAYMALLYFNSSPNILTILEQMDAFIAEHSLQGPNILNSLFSSELPTYSKEVDLGAAFAPLSLSVWRRIIQEQGPKAFPCFAAAYVIESLIPKEEILDLDYQRVTEIRSGLERVGREYFAAAEPDSHDSYALRNAWRYKAEQIQWHPEGHLLAPVDKRYLQRCGAYEDVLLQLVSILNGRINNKALYELVLGIQAHFAQIREQQLYGLFYSHAVLTYLQENKNYAENFSNLVGRMFRDEYSREDAFLILASNDLLTLKDIHTVNQFSKAEHELFYSCLLFFRANDCSSALARKVLLQLRGSLAAFSASSSELEGELKLLCSNPTFVRFLTKRLKNTERGYPAICNASELAQLVQANLFNIKNATAVCSYDVVNARAFVSILSTLTQMGMEPHEAAELLSKTPFRPATLGEACSESKKPLQLLFTSPEFIAFINKKRSHYWGFDDVSVCKAVLQLVQRGRCSLETLEAGFTFSPYSGSVDSFYKIMGSFISIPEATLREQLILWKHNVFLIAALGESLFLEVLSHDSLERFLTKTSYGNKQGVEKLLQLTKQAPLTPKELQQIAALQQRFDYIYIDFYTRLRALALPASAYELLLSLDYDNQTSVHEHVSKLSDEEFVILFSSEAVIEYCKKDKYRLFSVCSAAATLIKMHQHQMLTLKNLEVFLNRISFDEVIRLKTQGMQEHVLRMIVSGSSNHQVNPSFYSLFIAPAFAALKEDQTSLSFFLQNIEITQQLEQHDLLTLENVAVLARMEAGNGATFCRVLESQKNGSLMRHANAAFILENLDALYQLPKERYAPEAYKELVNRMVGNIALAYSWPEVLNTLAKVYVSQPLHLNLSILSSLRRAGLLTAAHAMHSLLVPHKHSAMYVECIRELHADGVLDNEVVLYVIEQLQADNKELSKLLQKHIIPALKRLQQTFNHIPEDSYLLVLNGATNSEYLAKIFITLHQLPLSQEEYQKYLLAFQQDQVHAHYWEQIFDALETVLPNETFSYTCLMDEYHALIPQFSAQRFKAFLYLKAALVEVPVDADDQAMLYAWLQDKKNIWPEYNDLLQLLWLCREIKTLPCYGQYQQELNSPNRMLYRGGLIYTIVKNELDEEIGYFCSDEYYWGDKERLARLQSWATLKQHGLYPEYKELSNNAKAINNLIQLKKIGLLQKPFTDATVLASLPDCEGLALLQNAYFKSQNPIYHEYQIAIAEYYKNTEYQRKYEIPPKDFSVTRIKDFIRLVEHQLYSEAHAANIFSGYARRSSTDYVDTFIFIEQKKAQLDRYIISALANGNISPKTVCELQNAGILTRYSHYYYSDRVAGYVIFLHAHGLANDPELMSLIIPRLSSEAYSPGGDSALLQALLNLRKYYPSADFSAHAKAMLRSCSIQNYRAYSIAVDALFLNDFYPTLIQPIIQKAPGHALSIFKQMAQLNQQGMLVANRDVLLKNPAKTNELCAALLILGPELYAPYKDFILANPDFALTYSRGCRALFDKGLRDEAMQSFLLVNPHKAEKIANLLIALKGADLYEDDLIHELLAMTVNCDGLIRALSQLKAYDVALYKKHKALLLSHHASSTFLTELLIQLHRSSIAEDTEIILQALNGYLGYYGCSLNAAVIVTHLEQLKTANVTLYHEHKALLLKNPMFIQQLNQALILLKTTGVYDSHQAQTLFAQVWRLSKEDADMLSSTADTARLMRHYYLESHSSSVIRPIMKLVFIAKQIQQQHPLESLPRDTLLSYFKKSPDYAEIYIHCCDAESLARIVFKGRMPNPYDVSYCLKRIPEQLKSIFLQKLNWQVNETGYSSKPPALASAVGFFASNERQREPLVDSRLGLDPEV